MTESEKRPEIRCRQMKSKLQSLELFGTAVSGRIIGRLSKSTIQTVQETKDELWVPIEFNIELCDAVKAEVGEQGIYQWGIKTFNNSINSSMIAPFIRVALNLFRTGPGTMIRFGPHLWKSIYRNCGEINVAKTKPGTIEILFQDMPPVMAQSRTCMVGVAAFLQGIVGFSGVSGQVVVEKLSPETQSAVIVASWSTD